jgi:formylglycine-generating enzyme required for sulfatase activity
MNKKMLIICLCVVFISSVAFADIFGSGANQFEMNFVDISGDTNPASGYGIVNYDYRIGVYEITNDQWNKFQDNYGTVTGNPSIAYDENTYWTGMDVPTNMLSWYEGAQFVNWLNTSTGHQEAYKFTGTLGTSDYTFAVWESGDAGYDASNPFRNSNAYYFLPTEDEWLKAAYWNGTSLQTYATINDSIPVAGVDTNYDMAIGQPWVVGTGSEELNGTFDMMGNVMERIESPYYSGDYGAGSFRVLRGGSYGDLGTIGNYLASSYRSFEDYMPSEKRAIGFRVSSVPEPATAALFGLGFLLLRRKK